MSVVTFSTVKNDLRPLGCKLKSQLDGTWAICEPKGTRVIVPTLEDVNLYILGKTGQAVVKPDTAKPPVEATPVAIPVTSMKMKIEESRSKPNPFLDKQESSPPARQATVNTAENTIAITSPKPAPITAPKPVITQNKPVDVEVSIKANLPIPSAEQREQWDLRLPTLKVELKSLGCQLKSQLDGSWAIIQPKGARVVVPTLEAVKEYYLSKSSADVAQPNSISKKVTQPLTAATLTNVAPNVPIPVATDQTSGRPISTSSHSNISEQQQLAIAAVNSFIRTMKENRLTQGLNFLHSEIEPNLMKHGCPEELVEKAFNYAEAKLYKDCMDKVLIKRTFENHLQQNDVMYFDIQYANLFASK